MGPWWKKKKEKKDLSQEIVDVTIDEVRKAVHRYATEMDQKISLRSIIKKDNEIDFDLLTSHLGGLPAEKFYMSKETFEIFEEPELPHAIDQCQLACDQYYLDTGEEPIVDGDRSRKISYFKLKNYLVYPPGHALYLDANDRMVTHREPTK